MAKDKVSVPSVQIGGNKPGMAFGGVIYSSDASVGYNGEPTKLNVNVALDSQFSADNRNKRGFDINKNDLNLASPVDISYSKVPLFRNMFLSSYNISDSLDSKVLSLTYSDGAVVLDRIFVGLIHEHFQVDRKKHTVKNLVNMTIRCPKPEVHRVLDTTGGDFPGGKELAPGDQKEGDGGTIVEYTVCSADDYTLSNRKIFRRLANATGDPTKPYLTLKQNKKDIWSGGYIVLGKEEFMESECEIADVSYPFPDLIKAVRQFGIKVDMSRFPERNDNEHFTRNYSGTLKEVLQNWGNDLGVTFHWDFSSLLPTLSVVDLTDKSIQNKYENAIKGIDALDKGHGLDMTGGSDIVINEKNQSNSLDGTFTQAFSSHFNRGPAGKQKNKKSTKEVFFSCQTLDSLASVKTIKNESKDDEKYLTIMGRPVSDFFTSMVLGKYAPDLRDIFNARCGMRAYESSAHGSRGFEEDMPDKAWARSQGYFRSLGFTSMIPLSFGLKTDPVSAVVRSKILAHAAIENMIASNLDGMILDAGELPKGPNGFSYDIWFGVYDENVKEYINNVEQEIANGFFGKHFVLSSGEAEYFQCNKLFKILETLQTKPSSEFYGVNQHYKTPMAKFLEKINDLKIEGLVASGVDYKNHLWDENNKLRQQLVYDCNKEIFTNRRQKGFFHFERNAPWSASREDVENLLNPYKLTPVNVHDWGVNNLYYPPGDGKGQKPRTKTNIVKDYLPHMFNMPALSQIQSDLPSKAYAVMADAQDSGKKIQIALCLTDNSEGGRDPQKIGHITIHGPKKRSNVIEEINALSSICDRKDEVKPDDVEECQPLCETDLVAELCSSKIFGQPDLTCGEAQELKDSAHSLEMMADEKTGQIRGWQLRITRSPAEGVTELKPAIMFNENNAPVPVPTVSATASLFADVSIPDSKGVEKSFRTTSITAPSENMHRGVLIYDRNLTVHDFGVRAVYDGLESVQPAISPLVSSIKYQTQDITQDVSSIYSEENREKILRGEIPVEIIADLGKTVITDSDDPDENYIELQRITAEGFHKKLSNNISQSAVDSVRESVNYKIYIDGGKAEKEEVDSLTQLFAYLKQENGLDSVSITNDESGYYLSVSFSNRPPVQPELEALFRMVGPIYKSTRTKYTTYRSL